MYRPQTLRQVLIGTGLTMSCISDGYIFGQLSGMVDAISKDPSLNLTEEDISWIASTVYIVCIIGFVIVSAITDYLGRRKAVTIMNFPVVASWILVYFAKDKTMLVLSRIILGVCFGGAILIDFIAIAEYMPPNIRPLCTNLITCVGGLVGTSLGHILSIVMHWRYVALIGIIPSSLATVLPFFWVESPAWLAYKGQFEECKKSFRALHPPNEDTDEKLKLLLTFEKTKRHEIINKDHDKFYIYRTALTKKYFWKILILSIVICLYRVATGRAFFSTLAITMLHDITGSSEILVSTFMIDGLTTAAAILGCIVLNKFKIRAIIFTSGVLANVCLFIFAFTLYLCPGSDYYSSWSKIVLLGLYFVIVTAGPYPVLDILTSEIFPLEIKSFIITVIGIISCILQFLCIQFAGAIIMNIGYHGLFFLFSGTTFLCLIYLWFYLPETRNRSLPEIEFYFKNNTFEYKKVLYDSNQINVLLNT